MFSQPRFSAAGQNQVGGVLTLQMPRTQMRTPMCIQAVGASASPRPQWGLPVCPKGVPFSEACQPGPRTELESPESRPVAHALESSLVMVVQSQTAGGGRAS